MSIDARLPSSWLADERLEGLTDRAHRVFVNGLMFSVSTMADGLVDRRAIAMLHPTGDVPDSCTAEIVAAGLWRAHPRGWVIVGYKDTQTTKAEHEARRAVSRKSTKTWREKQKREVARDASRDGSPQEGRKEEQEGRLERKHSQDAEIGAPW